MHGSCMHVSFSIKDYISLGDWAPHPIYYLISLGHVCVDFSRYLAQGVRRAGGPRRRLYIGLRPLCHPPVLRRPCHGAGIIGNHGSLPPEWRGVMEALALV